MKHKFLTVVVAAWLFLMVSILSGCSTLYQKGTPDEYPGMKDCLAKGGNYDYDGYDGSWSCDLL